MSLALSIVSHGHGPQVLALLDAIARLGEPEIARVVVTLNIPEPDIERALAVGSWPHEVAVLRNRTPKGFGANHNAAARTCVQDMFCVLNPDVRLAGNPFPALMQALTVPDSGCAYPVQVSDAGVVQASARPVPTPRSLLGRYLEPAAVRPGAHASVEWVSGACMLFKREVYRALDGFDEGYFMYCEDVDICLRLQNMGWHLVAADARVVHIAAGASHRNIRHFVWHVRSLARLWRSDALRAFRRSRGGA